MAALLDNWENVEAAVKAASEAEGSAARENSKYIDSIQGRIDKMTTSWQSLSNTFMNSNFLKGGISFITSIIEGVESLIDTFGTLPTLLGAFTAFESFKGVGIFQTIEDEAAASGKRIASIFSTSMAEASKHFSGMGINTNADFRNQLKFDTSALFAYRDAVKNGMSVTEAFSAHMTNASASAQAYAKTHDVLNEGIANFGKQQKAAQVTLTAQNNSLSSARAIIKEYNSGCKNTAMSQKDFISAVGDGNSRLGKYLSGLNGAKAGMAGYITSLVGAKVASIALEAATMALNTAITMGISALISWGISKLDEWIETADELSERVDEVVSKFNDQQGKLVKNQPSFESDAKRYAELSKGVNYLGENVSLTAEEYSEYQDIVSTIADQIPSLVAGYDSQGNAILSCAGNVDQLTAAYEKLIKAQNDEVLVNSAGDINKDFKNALKDAEHDTAGFFGWNWTKELGWGDSKLSMQSAEIYENILNSTDAIKEFNKAISTENVNDLESFLDNSDVDAMSELLEAAGFEKEGNFWSGKESNAEHIRRALEEDKSKVKDIIDQYYADLEEEAEAKKAQAQAALSNAFDLSDSMYFGMSDTMKNIAQQTVGAFDFKFFADLEKQGISVEKYVNNMLDQLNAISDSDEASIEAAFNLKTQFNSGDISYGEYVNGLENAGKLIDRLGLNEELTSQIKLSLGLDEEGFVENYQTLLNRLTETSNKKIASGNIIGLDLSEAESLLDSLSSEELSVMTQILPEIDANATREQIEAAINREMVLQGLTFDLNLEVEAAGIESLNTALSESVTASGLSSDSISALKSRYADLESQGYDLSSMFEETSHGIHLNRNELSKFENELSKQKLAEVDADLNEMKAAYDELGEAIKNCDDPLKKSELYNERQSLAQKISECATLASQYKGLTSAYNDWLAAESAGNERDMYENVITGFETVKDELSRGWADDGTIKFLEMLTGRTDLAGKSGKELKEVYDSLDKKIKNTTHSVKDFFTVDKDGNSTSKGVYNFLDAVGQLEEEAFGGKDIVKRDDKGNVIGFDFELAGGDEAIAEALGVSEELVQIMVRAADDAGFVVSMDGTYRQLADLQNEAKAAADYLKEIGKTDFDFDFNTSSVSNLKEQLKEAKDILKDKSFWNADGTFNFDAKGATEAMTVVSTLQAKLDTLTQEQYGIGLTVEDKEFEEPLENLQSYGKKVAALNQLELNPKANAEEIKELNGELDDIAEYFATLDTDTKVKLGFEAGDGIEEVKSKIESGEVKIPTTLDIQTNMDKNLSDLRDLALLNSGLLSEEQENAIKIRLGIELEGGEVDDSKLQEDIQNGVHDNSAYWSENKGKVTTSSDVEIKAGEVDTSDVDEAINNEVSTGAEGNLEYRFGVEPKPEIKDSESKGFGEKLKEWWDNVRYGWGKYKNPSEPVEIETEVEIKPASEVTISDNFESDVKTGAEGRLNGMGVDVDAEVNVDAKVDTSKAEEKTKKKTKEAVENQDGETTTVEKDVKLEFNISDYTDELSKFKDVAKELDGLEDVSLTVNANFEGNVLGASGDLNKIKTFAEGAKELQGAESSYITVSANLEGNVTDKDKLENIKTFAEGAKELDGAKSSYITVEANLEGNIDSVKNIDNIKSFAEGAKELKDVESAYINVDANLNGNIKDLDNLENIKTFAEGAKELKDVESVSVNVTAEISGSVLDSTSEKLENLKAFAEGAKELKGVENSNVTITANFEGTLKDASNIDNLATFVQNAKDLKDVKSSEVTITANVSGNALDSDATKLDNIKIFAEGAKELQGVKEVNTSVTANANGNALDSTDDKLDNLKTFAEGAKALQGVKAVDVSVTANINGNISSTSANTINDIKTFAEGAKELQGTKSSDVSVNANISGNLASWTGSLGDLAQFASNAKTLEGTKSSNVSVTANISGNISNESVSMLGHFSSVVNTLSTKQVNIGVKASIDTASINTAMDLLTKVANSGLFKDYNAVVTATVNYNKGEQTKPEDMAANVNYNLGTQANPKDKTAKVNYALGSQANPKSKTVYVDYVERGTAAGTAFAGGTSGRAFARGDWGIKGSGVALAGELGPEIVVRQGKFFTVGDSGAEFFRYKPHDIVFNAAQTESLFKYGGIKGAKPRGKMLASGTAFASGNAFSDGIGGGFWTNSSTGQSYGSKSSSSSDSSSDKDFEEVIDWIEVIIDRVERSIDKFDQQANNIYKSWSSRNSALQSEISEVSREINIQQQAYSRYLSAANGVGLSSSWAAKVRNGAIDISTIKDEALADKIKSYTEWYNKALDCQDAIRELQETESELYAQRFENIQTQYDGILQGYEHTEAMLNEYIAQAEEQGFLVSKKYYDALVANEKQNINALKQEQANLIAERDNAVASGKIVKGSEAWYEQCAAIDEVTQSIESGQTALLEYARAMDEIDWSVFDLIQERISAVSEESEFLVELLSNKKLHDDNGKLTSQGLATVGLHASSYNTNMYQADLAGEEAERLRKLLEADPYDTTLEERYREMIALQREYILAAEDSKNAIVDMVESGIDLELEALDEKIQKYEEALDSQKD